MEHVALNACVFNASTAIDAEEGLNGTQDRRNACCSETVSSQEMRDEHLTESQIQHKTGGSPIPQVSHSMSAESSSNCPV